MILKSLLICVTLFNLIICFPVYADEELIEEGLTETEIRETSAQVEEEPNLNSRAAIIYDKDTDMILYEKNAFEKRAMASTTKIMTAIVVLEQGELNDCVTVSKKAANTGGSRLGLKSGDKISVHDLLYGLMLKSGNDTAVALAEYIAGDLQEFSKRMNEKATKLNLNNTNFVTPHGLDDDNHYTTAYELACLTDYALQNKKFEEIVRTGSYTVTINGNPRTISNTNELLGYLSGVNGVKTGFTNNAGRCLVTSSVRGNQSIITVVLGADTKKFRTMDSIKLVEYAYANFEKINIEEKIKFEFDKWKKSNEGEIRVNKGVLGNISIKLEEVEKKIISVRKDRINTLEIRISSVNNFEAPLREGEIIGTVRVLLKNEVIANVNIINTRKIEKKNTTNYFTQLIKDII
ncbi:MAG: D-alanyl-D-alanine carboxypeptidase family protein [Clostridia bacterium]|nr:D-alanyl-D-alanine carboxypeptidase family protein [Clostridia bacterium]